MRSLKLELKARDLINKSDQQSRQKARNLRPRYEKGENNQVYFSVDSKSHPGKKNIVILSADSITEDVTTEDLKKILRDEDIRVSCTCEAFLYRGYKYITYRNKSGIEPEMRPPTKRNPQQKGMLCKHIIAVLNYLGIS